MKKIFLLFLLFFSALMLNTAFAGEDNVDIQVDVLMDSSDGATYNYQAADHTRGHAFLIQPPQSVVGKVEHYDQAEKDSPYFSEGAKMEKNMPVLVRYQIDNYLKTFPDKNFNGEAFSLYGVSVPPEEERPGDMIQILTGTTIPEGKIFIGSDFADSVGLKEFVSSKHLLLWSADQVLAAGGTCVLISGEGMDKFLASTGFQIGIGGGGGRLSDSENSYTQSVVGMSYSNGKSNYTKPPYLQISGGWLVDKSELELWWGLYESTNACDPAQTRSAEFVFSVNSPINGISYWDMLKLMSIEHWILGKRFTAGCNMPAELITITPVAKAVVPQTQEMTISGKEYTPDVLYVFGESKFLNQEQFNNAQKLVELTVRLAVSAKANGETVFLQGTCSGEGSKDLNLRLGYDRAEAIAAPARTVAIKMGVVADMKEATTLIQSVTSGKEWLEFSEPDMAFKNRRTRLIVGKLKSGVAIETKTVKEVPAPKEQAQPQQPEAKKQPQQQETAVSDDASFDWRKK